MKFVEYIKTKPESYREIGFSGNILGRVSFIFERDNSTSYIANDDFVFSNNFNQPKGNYGQVTIGLSKKGDNTLLLRYGTSANTFSNKLLQKTDVEFFFGSSNYINNFVVDNKNLFRPNSTSSSYGQYYINKGCKNTFKIYQLIITTSENNSIHTLRPCVDDEGIAGFYDENGGTIYYPTNGCYYGGFVETDNINIGSGNTKGIYIGSDEINKIYLGSASTENLLYYKNDVTYYDYLPSYTGDTFFCTNSLIFSNKDEFSYTLKGIIQNNTGKTTQFLFGYYLNNNIRMYIGLSSAYTDFYINSASTAVNSSTWDNSNNTYIDITINKNIIHDNIKGTDILSISRFPIVRGILYVNSKMIKIKELNVENNGTPIVLCRPAYSTQEGSVWLYDTINKKFLPRVT